MILNGNQRGGGLKLAAHLCNVMENDHVELHELRGFVSETMRGAMQEAEAIAKGTQCKQFLFSLSLNPPETENVPVAAFETAISTAEERLGLTGQPRAIVFHEKNGRRHAHVVWSRIDVKEMKAINLPFYHNRLTELSKDLFLEHHWRLPKGLRDRENRNPTNFTLAEWQQAKRAKKDPRDIKRVFREAWQCSDDAASFASALEEKGFYLARGDRRGYVAVDVQGEVYAVPKWTGVKTKDVREKLGKPDGYASVEETNAKIASQMNTTLSRWDEDLARQAEALSRSQAKEKARLKEQQKHERQKLKTRLNQRREAEARMRQSMFRRGLSGLWDRLLGEHGRIRHENEQAAWQAHLRDQNQSDDLIFRHLEERRHLKRSNQREQDHLQAQAQALSQDRERFDWSRSHEQLDRTQQPAFDR
ncbi:relaxase [uncultured Roseobacter sp.]|uniref:relaxase/mobilization nuclease domain-containing protein n=1 Tax=uncultured Roseobacter sp. TaxID=114847 RepID=UPI00260648C7|nr:relaxase [uncultured Roseobacter sp.]